MDMGSLSLLGLRLAAPALPCKHLACGHGIARLGRDLRGSWRASVQTDIAPQIIVQARRQGPFCGPLGPRKLHKYGPKDRKPAIFGQEIVHHLRDGDRVFVGYCIHGIGLTGALPQTSPSENEF
jgi:hypothetical protein